MDPERRHYVAFTRPQHLLALTANGQPLPRFKSISDRAVPWDDSAKQHLSQQRFPLTHSTTTHERFSVTGDVQLYETRPRQYQFFKVYGFAKPYRPAHTFGQLVHRSIDLIHRSALAGNAANATTGKIRRILSKQHTRLVEVGYSQLNLAQRAIALSQVQRYWQHAQDTADAIIGSEVEVSIDGTDHTITGRFDLITRTNRETELTDFKTGHRNSAMPETIGSYVRQLALYAEMLGQHDGQPAQRLSIHWTAETDVDQAIYTVENTGKLMADARMRADRAVRNIRAGAFNVHKPPGPDVCNQCNLLKICQQDGTLRQ